MNFLGIDIGTTSVKAAAFDESLNMKASLTADYTLDSHGDIVEFDANEYWNIVKGAIDEIRGKVEIDALAVDTQCETMILTDGEGNPLCPAIVWLDNRATEEAELIASHFGHKRVYEVTGQPEITATWPACKLLWVKRNKPEIWDKVERIFLLEDWILYKLTGKFITEKTLQSSTIYLNIKTGEWWDEMLDFVGVDKAKLPELLPSAKLVGEYDGIKVVTGAIDQIAGAIGAGVVKQGTVSVMTGTTMVIFLPADSVPEYDPKSIVPCHVNYDGKYCLLSWTPTAGMALKWFKNAFCESFSFRELDTLAENVSPGCDGLTFLPYLCGSTMPKYNPEARGSFTGLTAEHTRGHFVRGVMESVACMLKSNLDYLGLDVNEIRAMGGIAIAVKANCLEKASLEEARETVNRELGECDILINGAGGNNPRATTDNEYFDAATIGNPDVKDFFDLTPEGFKFVLDLNVTAAFLTTQVFALDMAKSGKGGNIINISSMNAYRPLTKIPAYSAAKSGVSNLTQWLAVHFANAGIRVNAIAPGFFVTNQNRALLFREDGTATPRTDKILRGTPMNRFGESEELIGGLLFFLSDAASGFITGVVLPIDGGFSAYSGV